MTTETFKDTPEKIYAPDADFSEVPGYIDEATEYPSEEETDASAQESEGSVENLEDMTEKMVKYVRKHLRRLVGEHLHAFQATTNPNNGDLHQVVMDKAIGAGLEFAFVRFAIGGPQVKNSPELSGVRTVTITTNGDVFANAFTDKTTLYEAPGVKSRAYLASCNAIIGLGNDAEYVATHDPLLNSQRMTPEQLNALCILLLELVATEDHPVTVDSSGDGTHATVTQWGQRLIGHPQMRPGYPYAHRETLSIAA